MGWRLNSETFVSLACTGSARCPTNPSDLESLVVAQRVEHLDTLAREPMVIEHPSGALFVAGYNRHYLRLWKSTDHGAGCGFDPLTGPRWVDPLAWDATGALFALWGSAIGVWLRRSRDRGASWTSWRVSSDAALAYFPYLASRGYGALGATWFTGADSTLRWHVARLDVDGGDAPRVRLSQARPLESWRGTPPRADTGGEYLATAWLRDGSLAVVTPIQHESAGRLGFTWWRFATH